GQVPRGVDFFAGGFVPSVSKRGDSFASVTTRAAPFATSPGSIRNRKAMVPSDNVVCRGCPLARCAMSLCSNSHSYLVFIFMPASCVKGVTRSLGNGHHRLSH